MSNESGTEPKSRKKTWIVVGLLAVVVLAVTGGMYWYTQVSVPHEAAIAEFDEAAASYDAAVPGLEVKNDALTTKITELENLTNSGRQPLDPDLLQSSGALIGEAQASVVDVPAMPIRAEEARSSSTEEIREYTAQLREITSQITSVEPPDAMVAQLAAATIELENSMRQMEQVTNPSEQFVIARLTGLPTITGVQAATEENDPNGQLNKQGGTQPPSSSVRTSSTDLGSPATETSSPSRLMVADPLRSIRQSISQKRERSTWRDSTARSSPLARTMCWARASFACRTF